MARYSPELLAALRYRHEQTDQPMNALAADFGIGVTTLQTLARKNGWSPRSQRMRHCPPAMQLLDEADALATSLPPPERGRSDCEAVRVGVDATPAAEATPTPTLPLSGGGSALAPDGAAQISAPAESPLAIRHLSKTERLESLVEKEIAAEEATRDALGIRPRSRNEAERCARTISKLTQTLQAIQKLRADGGAGARTDDEPPRDMDAFRDELARRINGLIENQIGRDRMAMNEQMSGLTDDEVKELIQAGRERGMQALLQPPREKEASATERNVTG